MKQYKKITAIIMVLAMIIALCSCGGMTAEKLVKEMKSAAEEKTMTQGNAEMEINMEISAQGLSMGMDMGISIELKMSEDPYASYSNMEMRMKLFGQEMTETTKTYTVVESGNVVNYIHRSSTDSWERYDMGIALTDLQNNYVGYNWISENAADITLAEQTQNVDGYEVYVLKCSISGEDIVGIMKSIQGISGLFEGSTLDGLEFLNVGVPAVFYIDKETYLPIKIEMDVDGFSEIMSGILSGILSEMAPGLNMEISINEITAVYGNIGYDEIEIPELPAAAKSL